VAQAVWYSLAASTAEMSRVLGVGAWAATGLTHSASATTEPAPSQPQVTRVDNSRLLGGGRTSSKHMAL
jgi:hypothetical protein